ncbi:MAG: dihydroorotase family protein [Candidatus Korarchaeum sp.]
MVCFCGKLMLPIGFVDSCIEVEGGEIRGIAKTMGGCEQVDLVLPGMIDLHVHMRGLDQRHKGDWKSESLAALSGGVTVVADMPNNVPRIDNPEALRMKLEEATRESFVDFALYTAYPYLTEMSTVVGVKVYPEDMWRGLRDLFRRAAQLGKEVIVHAEDPIALMEAESVEDVREHPIARPEVAEEIAVVRAISLAEMYGGKLRIAHATLPSTLVAVKEARVRGLQVRAEVTPHHLLFSSDDAEKLRSLFKVNPPIRRPEIRNKLLKMVEAGYADFLVTDHAPHSPEEKSRGYEEMPPGIPWLDALTPFLLQCVEEGSLPYRALLMYSSEPASHLGLRRGSLLPGNLADLVILRRVRWEVKLEDLYTKAKVSPLLGRELRWRVDRVLLRGEVAFQDGPTVPAGFGKPAL